jgi:AbrB family looped-hinge helix DNA binding protein
MPNQTAMDKVAQSLPTKSAKIRALARAGFKNAVIARYLGIRDQHVSNVLRQDADKKREATDLPPPVVTRLGPEGRIVIPADYRRSAGLKEGDEVIISLDGDTVRLVSREGAIRRVQAEIARHVPASVSLVDELIAERRQEATRGE